VKEAFGSDAWMIKEASSFILARKASLGPSEMSVGKLELRGEVRFEHSS
jgi:hypothetical protein